MRSSLNVSNQARFYRVCHIRLGGNWACAPALHLEGWFGDVAQHDHVVATPAALG